jgi:hypothetical protein
MGSPDKRAHERKALRRATTVRNPAGAELEATVENVGALGALISTEDLETALAVGDRVSLRLGIDDEEHEVAGEILRLDQEFVEGDIRRTFAVKFDDPVDA